MKSLGNKRDMNRSQAKAACDRLAQEMAVTPAIRDQTQSPLIEDWIQTYVQMRTDLAESTINEIRVAGSQLLKFFAATRLHDIKPLDARKWRAWISEGRADATVRKHCRIVKGIFAYAVDCDVIALNPFAKLPSSSVASDQPIHQLTHEQVSQLIATADGDWKPLIALCSLAGLRRSEALALQWSDVGWNDGRLTVEHEGKRTTKKRRRTVRMEPELEAILLDHFHDGVSPTVCAPAGKDPVIVLSASNMSRRIRQIIKRAGLDDWTKPLHTLRKWRATTWRAKYPEHVVDAWLGHSLAVARTHYVTVEDSYYAREPKHEVRNNSGQLTAARQHCHLGG